MAETADAVVIGAGVVGAGGAQAPAAAGRCGRGGGRAGPGAGATGAGMGHIVVHDASPAELALTGLGRALWASTCQEEPAHGHIACGTVWVATDTAGLEELRGRRLALAAAGLSCEALGPQALHEAEPHLRPGPAGGLLVPGDALLPDPVHSTALVLERARARGARMRQARVVRLLPGGVALADGTALSAGAVVLATGALAPELAGDVPVGPKKGHLAVIAGCPNLVRHEVMETGYSASTRATTELAVAFNVQGRPNGDLVVGASRQPGNATAGVEPEVVARLLERAAAFLPALAGRTAARAWSGVRAAVPDGLPLIGPHPGRPGLWLACGHEGLGLTTAPATARLLAAQILGTTPEIPPDPYLPARLLAAGP